MYSYTSHVAQLCALSWQLLRERGLPSWAHAEWICTESWEPAWLAHPDTLLFLAASMVASNMLVYYHQLNVRDKFQKWIVWVSFLASLMLGLFYGHGILASMLTDASWGVYFGLIASDAFHTAMKFRKLPGEHGPDDHEKQQTGK
jgi:hypothetical protein